MLALALILAAATVSYDVRATDGARILEVTAELPKGVAEMVFEDGVGSYAIDRAVRRGGTWTAVAGDPDRIRVPCDAAPCALRYRFRLGDLAAQRRRRNMTAFEEGGALVAPPSTWLARPTGVAGRFSLGVHTPEGLTFASGLSAGRGRGTYEAELRHLADAPYSAFGPFTVRSSVVAGATVDLAVLPGRITVGEAALTRWAEEAARDVAGYYGRLPVPRVLVIVVPGGRRPVGYGTTMGNGGASILVWVGPDAREEHLERDWVLTHEMVHLALPNLRRAHFWLEEGIATYVEPIARARRGRFGVADVWKALAEGLPKGLPADGDQGLDGTSSWGRTYWGGALFCFLADVTLREKTGNRRGLEDALRGVVEAGGSIADRWDLDRVLEVADRATGQSVLRDLYSKMGPAPLPVDLASWWSRLGVGPGAGALRDDAPLAAVRRAITRPEPASRGDR